MKTEFKVGDYLTANKDGLNNTEHRLYNLTKSAVKKRRHNKGYKKSI